MVRLIIAVIIIAAVLMLFGQIKPGGKQYIGGISPNLPKGAGGADNSSALPRGYRTDAPYSPYTATST